ncbi:hypothetical protein QW131_15215 [Roseibium salinum]|nr:hypothetical protein [Roseibium salinum]
MRLGDQYTKEECDAKLLASLRRHEAGMRRCLKRPDVIPTRSYVAFVSLTYNIGVGAFFAGRRRGSVSIEETSGAPAMLRGGSTRPAAEQVRALSTAVLRSTSCASRGQNDRTP